MSLRAQAPWRARWCAMDEVAGADIVLSSLDDFLTPDVGEAAVLVAMADGVRIGIKVQARNVNDDRNEILDGYSEQSLFIIYFGKLYLVEFSPKPAISELSIFPCQRTYVRGAGHVVFHDFFRLAIVGSDGMVKYIAFDFVSAIEELRLDEPRRQIHLKLLKNWGEEI